MKVKFILLFLLIIYSSKSNYAQDVESSPFSNTKEITTAHLKNTIIIIDNQSFDYRVLKHYSEQELNSISSIKRKQIHFIYTNSYSIKNLDNCTTLKLSDIDVSKIETLRLEDTTNIVLYGTDCKVYVELISRKTLNQKLEELNK